MAQSQYILYSVIQTTPHYIPFNSTKKCEQNEPTTMSIHEEMGELYRLQDWEFSRGPTAFGHQKSAHKQ